MPLDLISRRALTFEATTKADEARAWDAAAAEKRLRKWASRDGSGDADQMDWKKYRRGFAWYDAGAAEQFGGYKLAHHDVVDDALVVVWKGCAAAAAVCMGARGGADIPEEEMPRLKSHLGRHYAQFDKSAPWDEEEDREAEPSMPVEGPEAELETRMLWRPPMALEIRQVEPAEGAGEDEWTEYEFPISSELPVERWFGQEILGHKPGECHFDRLKDGASVRDGHWGDQIGVCEDAWLENRRLWVRMRFSRNARPQEIERDVKDLIRRNVSAGYVPVEMLLVKEDKAGGKTYRVTNWEVYHVAFVPDGADPTVGIGRGSDAERTYLCRVRGGEPAREGNEMPEKLKEPAQPRGAGGEEPTVVVTRAEPPKKTRSEEVTEIRGAFEEYQVPDGVRADILGRELTPDQARGAILTWMRAQLDVQAQPPAESLTAMGLSRQDAAKYRYTRAIAMAANLIRRDGLEAEVSRHLERRRPVEQANSGGIFVPYRLIDGDSRALDTVTKGQGAELIAPGVEFIDMLRNAMVLARLGAVTLPGLSGPITFAKKTVASTMQWLGEGKAITPSDIKFIPLEAVPKRIGGAQDISRELLIQSSIDSELMVRQDLADGASLALDYGALFGAGGAEPLGLWNLPSASGLQTSAMGGVPTYAKVTGVTGKTAKKNALFGTSIGWAATPELAAVLMATPKVSGAAAGFIWEGGVDDGLMAGHRAISSAQMRADLGTGSDEHALLFGTWRFIRIPLWGGAELVIDPYTQALNNNVRVVMNMLGNVICTYPDAFVKCTGAKLA